ncbi:MAG: hypothetical protein M3256_01785 [Actinomycetota bacterium]|nr:hypothetical protein [Actinomycetota bacterium]
MDPATIADAVRSCGEANAGPCCDRGDTPSEAGRRPPPQTPDGPRPGRYLVIYLDRFRQLPVVDTAAPTAFSIGWWKARPLSTPPAWAPRGLIGYSLLQSSNNIIPGRDVATSVTHTPLSVSRPYVREPHQVRRNPSTAKEAERLAAEPGWSVKPDRNSWHRRGRLTGPIPLR